jgi:hypothetical protein
MYSFNQWIVLAEPKKSGHSRLIDIDVTGVYIFISKDDLAIVTQDACD